MNKDDKLIWLAIAALLIAATGTGLYFMSRGIRNNNPGNIRHGASNWQGMSSAQTDKDYIQFDDPVYGIRAIAKLLKNYQTRYGLNTVAEIINRWAPPSENITGAYVKHVAEVAGVKPDQEILIDDYMRPVILTIIQHENGRQPYTVDQIEKGISLA